MSIIFGTINSPGRKVAEIELNTLAAATERYAPDGTFLRVNNNVGMGFQPFHTHERSRLESQPAIDSLGNLLVFDGRLDNHADLAADLQFRGPDIQDSLILLAAFERWGEQCFPRLIGDWALALWSAQDRTLYLACDPAGTRTLYYQSANGKFRWSTYLETFFADSERYPLDRECATRFLCGEPVGDLTPYQGIRAVLAAHYLAIKDTRVCRSKRWEWIPEHRVCHKSDSEYEEHFFELFQQAVVRRTGSGAPILAELSGGMDSTSIVCMSDHVCKRSGKKESQLLDTVSYWEASEPSWDEKPYFLITEARRGKQGIHIETRTAHRSYKPIDVDPLPLWPGLDSTVLEQERALQNAVGSRGYRAVLSGVGGDELLGGVPTPLPELADHLVAGRVPLLLHQSVQWCVASRTPLLHLLWQTLAITVSLYWTRRAIYPDPPAWVLPTETSRPARFPSEDPDIGSLLKTIPSRLAMGITWNAVVETLPHRSPGHLARFEFRYPYLDQDLVSYLARIPRSQLVRPGRRRSLMRRALKDIVPIEILERRRKAYLIRGPLVALQQSQKTVLELFRSPLVGELGLVDPRVLRQEFERAITGNPPAGWITLHRAILLELWLRSHASASRRTVPGGGVLF